MHLATEGFFTFNDKLYKQIDGMAMGSPLDPTIANFFLGNPENSVFEHSSPSHPKIYFRYVDDVFAVLDDNPAVDSFLNILNNFQNNIKFTVEKSTASIHFLDVDVKVNNDGTFETCVWRKPTHTGLFLNFDAACPVKSKSGLILCMLHRAKSICSSKNLFFNEVNKLKSFFYGTTILLHFLTMCLNTF